MRTFTLAKQTDGINLLRSKGGASDTALFDLVNGWVSPKGTINARPGSRKVLRLPPGSVGVFGHQGKFHTFAASALTSADARVVVNILRHPTGGAAALAQIHCVFPQLGRLYVVAEFADGVVQHYWLDLPPDWTANTIMSYGARVQPVVKNGFYYRITNIPTAAAWQASTTKIVGDVVQPSVANGFTYTATSITGTAPVRTGSVEPTWPTTEGATVVERRYFTDIAQAPGSPTTPPPPVPSSKPGDYTPYPPPTTEKPSGSQH